MNTRVKSFMMPFSNVAHLPFREKVQACRAAGYGQIALMPTEVEALLASGNSARDLVAVAAEHGVVISRLDPLNTWPRIWRPNNMTEDYIASVDTSPERMFELCELLGCTHISLNALYPLNAMTVEEVTEHYAAICRRAATHGVVCDLEFIPLWGVPTLELAWNIVGGAGETNSGIVFDSWHFVRGESKLATLQALPKGVIHCVQLSDGPLPLPAGITLTEDCYNRLWPGEGAFPLVDIVRTLADLDALEELGPEIFSPTLKALSAENVATRCRNTITATLTAAGVGAGNTN